MCLDSPYDVVSQNLLVALFGENKLSTDVLGTEKTIKKITDKTLYECYNSFYRYSNMALVVSGDVDESSVLEVVNEYLPKKEKSNMPTLQRIEYGEKVNMPVIEKAMAVSMPVFEIGIKDKMPSPNISERLKRDVELTILDEMLFSRAGRLYNELFESGMINESYSYGYSITRDVAFHSIYGEGEDPIAVLERIKAYLKEIKKSGLCERDFIRCKRVMMAEFIRDFDSVDDIANSVLNFAFEGTSIFEYRKIIENVTFSDVVNCLDESFEDSSFAISIIKK
jgi:predicted Zn-dependent peptidase